MQQQYIDSVLGMVILNESRRACNVSIRVSRSTDNITLTYPIGYNPKLAIKFLEEKRERIIAIKERQRRVAETLPPTQKYDMEELRKAAIEYLPSRIAELSEITRLRYTKVTIRATRSKWGSCTSENNISLSTYLMTLPKHLIDFVILHELCHTIHHNHSARFHNLLNLLCNGKESDLNKELRRYSTRQ